jgi:hypothetical protein
MRSAKALRVWAALAAAAYLGQAGLLTRGATQAKPLAEPAKLVLSVSPERLPPGSEARVTLQLQPVKGVKINRYPQIQLSVPEQAGLVGEAKVALGDQVAPPPEKMTGNYFDPPTQSVELRLKLDPAIVPGSHDFQGKLTYFYCVPESGFCAPVRTTVRIPVTVR